MVGPFNFTSASLWQMFKKVIQFSLAKGLEVSGNLCSLAKYTLELFARGSLITYRDICQFCSNNVHLISTPLQNFELECDF